MEIAVSSKAQALLSNATKAASFTAYQNSKSQIIIHADIGTLTEVGESWDSDCKYFVGVVDEQETSVTLHPADVVQVSTFVKKTENSKRKVGEKVSVQSNFRMQSLVNSSVKLLVLKRCVKQ